VRAVTKDAADESTRWKASEYFKKEFELDYALANLRKPYVAIMDGITMGGGLGLSVHAPFRVATEKTQVAMPETKIGYVPDVGATYFLPKLDGKLGTYLALTGNTVVGSAVYALGIATHYVASSSIPKLLERLATLELPVSKVDGIDPFNMVDAAITEFSASDWDGQQGTDLIGDKRKAIDAAFGKSTVEEIVKALEEIKEEGGELAEWTEKTLGELALRSPTALKVALHAQTLGSQITLAEALQVELRIATAFCSGASPDFLVGVKAVLEDKIKERPNWQPSTLEEISRETIYANFFSADSPYLQSIPRMDFQPGVSRDPMQYALPSEEAIGLVVRGYDRSSGSTAVSMDEVIARFQESERPAKLGLMEKISEVVDRKCNTKWIGDQAYLEWIH